MPFPENSRLNDTAPTETNVAQISHSVYPCAASNGEMVEWSKAHAWKVCIRKRIEGSNPSLSAIYFIYLINN
jgi:hypothetical protein